MYFGLPNNAPDRERQRWSQRLPNLFAAPDDFQDKPDYEPMHKVPRLQHFVSAEPGSADLYACC